MTEKAPNSILSSIRPAAEAPYGKSAHRPHRHWLTKDGLIALFKSHQKWITLGLGIFVFSFLMIVLFVPFSLKSRANDGQPSAQYEYGMDLFYQERYSDALTYLKKSADSDYAPAAYKLGWYYKEGINGEQDFDLAEKYLSLAADKGEVNAQLMLGKMYLDGNGITQDYTKAFHYLKEAANHDQKEAAYHTAVLFAVGKGVEQDYDSAYGYAKKASLTDDNPLLKLLKEKRAEHHGE